MGVEEVQAWKQGLVVWEHEQAQVHVLPDLHQIHSHAKDIRIRDPVKHL